MRGGAGAPPRRQNRLLSLRQHHLLLLPFLAVVCPAEVDSAATVRRRLSYAAVPGRSGVRHRVRGTLDDVYDGEVPGIISKSGRNARRRAGRRVACGATLRATSKVAWTAGWRGACGTDGTATRRAERTGTRLAAGRAAEKARRKAAGRVARKAPRRATLEAPSRVASRAA